MVLGGKRRVLLGGGLAGLLGIFLVLGIGVTWPQQVLQPWQASPNQGQHNPSQEVPPRPTWDDPPQRKMDDLLADVARRVPSFTGLSYQRGILSVSLVNPDDKQARDAAIQAIADVFGEHRVAGEVRFVRGEYPMRRLREWYEILKQGLGENEGIWAIPEVTAIDLAEGRNRLFIGVQDVDASGKVMEMVVRDLGIPREAVEVGYLGRPEPIINDLETEDLPPPPTPTVGPTPTVVVVAGEQVTVKLQGEAGRGYAFAPPTLELEAGKTYTITLVSTADEFHTWTVVDQDGENIENISVNGDETRIIEFTAPDAGTYRVVCLPHAALGMTGEIVVK